MNGIVVTLEWTFSPPGYFEEVVDISDQGYAMRIEDGRVTATIAAVIYDADPNMRNNLDGDVRRRFQGAQFVSRESFELSGPNEIRAHPSGRIDHTIFAELDFTTTFAGAFDILIVNRDGQVITDTKRERIEKKKRFAEIVAAHGETDAVLASLLRSHEASIRDPDDELVHLYEIRDALASKYGGKAAATAALGVSGGQWDDFGEICNKGSLRQGRHRGRSGGALRAASAQELNKARAIARELIEGYLRKEHGF